MSNFLLEIVHLDDYDNSDYTMEDKYTTLTETLLSMDRWIENDDKGNIMFFRIRLIKSVDGWECIKNMTEDVDYVTDF